RYGTVLSPSATITRQNRASAPTPKALEDPFVRTPVSQHFIPISTSQQAGDLFSDQEPTSFPIPRSRARPRSQFNLLHAMTPEPDILANMSNLRDPHGANKPHISGQSWPAALEGQSSSTLREGSDPGRISGTTQEYADVSNLCGEECLPVSTS